MNISLKNSSQVGKAIAKKLKRLNSAKVESGVFSEQGMHPTAEMTFADLAYLNAKGTEKGKSRDIRPSVAFTMKGAEFTKLYRRELAKFLTYKADKLDESLDVLGYKITATSKDFFGVPSQSNPMNSTWWANVKGGNTPLVNEGHLMDAWSYKTSEDGTLKGAL